MVASEPVATHPFTMQAPALCVTLSGHDVLDFGLVAPVTVRSVAAQVARRASASAAGVPGAAVYAKSVSPPSPGSCIAWKASSKSPMAGWWKVFVPVRWNRTCDVQALLE
ncbi:hypothetical protein SRABI02_02968 [Plantibacter cousiniae]|nr:hypothetical protein SRABI02_02968 [Plantibacter cousiniae]